MSSGLLKGHILIAEDNPVNQNVMQEMVRLLNCTFQTVDNGEAVLQALRESKFDLVLMDGQMPKMDGYEATRQIRNGAAGEVNRNIPIVATTANTDEGDLEKCLQAGMNDYLSKPISYEELAVRVEKWLARGPHSIDSKQLNKMVDLSIINNPDFMQKISLLFEQETSGAFRDMKTFMASGDSLSVSKAAHTLKSSSASLGAMRLRDLFERIEKASASGTRPEHILMMIDAAEREFRQAVQELKQSRSSQAT